jgi:hypothetical protein
VSAPDPRGRDLAWQSLKLSAPARRALVGAGISSFEELSGWRQCDLLKLHGMGPNAMGTLTQAMADVGCTFEP